MIDSFADMQSRKIVNSIVKISELKKDNARLRDVISFALDNAFYEEGRDYEVLCALQEAIGWKAHKNNNKRAS